LTSCFRCSSSKTASSSDPRLAEPLQKGAGEHSSLRISASYPLRYSRSLTCRGDRPMAVARRETGRGLASKASTTWSLMEGHGLDLSAPVAGEHHPQGALGSAHADGDHGPCQ